MKRIIATAITLITVAFSFANETHYQTSVTLTQLEVFQPQSIGQQVLHNFPAFKNEDYLTLNQYDVSYTTNEEGQLHGEFFAYRYYAGSEGIGTYRERFIVNYANGIVQGEASYELAFCNANYWDHDYICASYTTQEELNANYFYGECEYIVYHNDFFTPYMEAEALLIQVNEEWPVSVSLDYFRFVAEYELRIEEDRPTLNMRSTDESVVSLD